MSADRRDRADEVAGVDDDPVAQQADAWRRARLAQAITIRLFPVKSSAPATTTRIRPSEKARPPSSRATP